MFRLWGIAGGRGRFSAETSGVWETVEMWAGFPSRSLQPFPEARLQNREDLGFKRDLDLTALTH